MGREEDKPVGTREARGKNGTNNINGKKKNENAWVYNKKTTGGRHHAGHNVWESQESHANNIMDEGHRAGEVFLFSKFDTFTLASHSWAIFKKFEQKQ